MALETQQKTVLVDTTTGDVYDHDQYGIKQTGSGGAARVHTKGGAGVGQFFNREASSAQISTINGGDDIKFTWVATQRPRLVEIQPIGGAVWVCFDAPDDATADAWLDGEGGESTDSQRFLVPEYIPESTEVAGGAAGDYGKGPTNGNRVFTFEAGLSQINVIEYSTALTALNTVGVE